VLDEKHTSGIMCENPAVAPSLPTPMLLDTIFLPQPCNNSFNYPGIYCLINPSINIQQKIYVHGQGLWSKKKFPGEEAGNEKHDKN